MGLFFLFTLLGVPGIRHRIETRISHTLIFCFKITLHTLESFFKFIVTAAQGGFRIDPRHSGEVGYHKEEVAQFFGLLFLRSALDRFTQFVQFLGQLGKRAIKVRPLEAGLGCLLLQLLGA